MKIQSNSNNKVSHKAYIKPNTNFHILYGREMKRCGGLDPKSLKQFSELPNHCLEILQLNKLSNLWNKNIHSKERITDTTECVVLNQTTKQTANIILEDNCSPLNMFMKKIIELKNERFFLNTLTVSEEEFYDVLTTGRPLNQDFITAIDKLK